MNVGGMGGMGGMSYLQGMMKAPQQAMSMGGATATQQADNEMARKQLPLQVAQSAGRAMTEAKGMFVDTYA